MKYSISYDSIKKVFTKKNTIFLVHVFRYIARKEKVNKGNLSHMAISTESVNGIKLFEIHNFLKSLNRRDFEKDKNQDNQENTERVAL